MNEHHLNCISKYRGACNCIDLETVTVCTDCHGEVQQQGPICDTLSVCQACGNIEQGTEEWSLDRFDEEGTY